MALLAPDVRLVSDAGGKAKAARRVIETADKVGRFLAAVGQEVGPDWDMRVAEFNGGPAVACFVGESRTLSSRWRSGTAPFNASISFAIRTSSQVSPLCSRSAVWPVDFSGQEESGRSSSATGPRPIRGSPPPARWWGFMLRVAHGTTNVL